MLVVTFFPGGASFCPDSAFKISAVVVMSGNCMISKEPFARYIRM